MVIFWTTPRNVRIAKIVAVALTILFLILPIIDWHYIWTPREQNQWVFAFGFLFGTFLEVFLIAIVIFECNCFILIAVVLLAFNLVVFTVSANFLLLIFAISSMTTHKNQYNIKDESDALLRCLVMELIIVIIWILFFVRYYAVLTVYRWTRLPRVTVTTKGGPKITVQNI